MLAAFGFFLFELRTASANSLALNTAARWATNDRIKDGPDAQFLGAGVADATIDGVIYPELTGGVLSLSILKKMLESGKSYPLISGRGDIFGSFFLESVAETHSQFLPNGAAQKIEFSLKFKKTEQPIFSQLGDLTPFLGSAAALLGASLPII